MKSFRKAVSSNSYWLQFSIVLLAAGEAIQHAQSVAHAAAVRTVALMGEPAPGVPGGAVFGGWIFFPPVINDAGQTAFWAGATGGNEEDSPLYQGIWSEGTGSLAPVALTRNLNPGDEEPPPGFYEFDPYSIRLNNAGQTAFWADHEADGKGIWSDRSGSVVPIARGSDPAPGTPYTFNIIGVPSRRPVWNEAGQAEFSNGYGIWSEGSGTLSLVARAGDPAPGMPAGTQFVQIGAPLSGALAFNNSGKTAFAAQTNRSDVGIYGVWSGGAGTLELVASQGVQAPGMPTGNDFFAFGPPVINSSDKVAFGASTTDGSGGFSGGIWTDRSGSLELVTRNGNQAPGAPSGLRFEAIYLPSLALNDAGDTAFYAELTDESGGIWSESFGGLGQVARSGDPAPGTADGVIFAAFSPYRLVLNGAGQVAFTTTLFGDGVDFSNDRGIWATDYTGALRLVARTGDSLEVAPGDFRTIKSIDFVGAIDEVFSTGYSAATGNSDGRPSGFNNLGQLAFLAEFSDFSQGIFVSNAVAHLPGDFNHDGTVDGADYIIWRKNPGGIYTQNDYTVWRANFGATLGSGSGGTSNFVDPNPAVPEPSSVLLLVFATGLLCANCRRITASASTLPNNFRRPQQALDLLHGQRVAKISRNDRQSRGQDSNLRPREYAFRRNPAKPTDAVFTAWSRQECLPHLRCDPSRELADPSLL